MNDKVYMVADSDSSYRKDFDSDPTDLAAKLQRLINTKATLSKSTETER